MDEGDETFSRGFSRSLVDSRFTRHPFAFWDPPREVALAWPIESLYLLPMRASITILPILLILITSASAQLPLRGSAAAPSSCSRKSEVTGISQRNAPAAFADPSIDVTYYRLDLHLWTSSSALSGSVLMKARSLIDSLHTVVLDLMNVMLVDSVRANGMPVGFL